MAIYDRTFDYDNDGKLDAFEEYAYMDFNDRMMHTGLYAEEDIEDEDEELEDELESAGLDMIELEMIDEDERAEALFDAGLDPDDFDF